MKLNTKTIAALALAVDYMVFNVTKDGIRVRMAAIDEDIWPQPATQPKRTADLSKRIGFSKEVISGRIPYPEWCRTFTTTSTSVTGPRSRCRSDALSPRLVGKKTLRSSSQLA